MAKEKYDAGSIKVLKGLEAVRKRPGMYIGSTTRKGLNHMLHEIIDNSVDESLAGFCDEICVTINEDGSATVSDNGRGIPVDLHKDEKIPAERVVFTMLHAGGKFSNDTYKISGGLHGVGSSVVNALSKKLIVDVYRDGFVHHDTYEMGVPTTELVDGYLPKEKIRGKRTGTVVTCYPDDTIFETIKFKADSIFQRCKETCYLNPNLTIRFQNKRDGKDEIVIHSPGGLSDFIKDISGDLSYTSPIISISGERDGIFVDVVFVMTEDGEEFTASFTNNIINPDGGTHVNGFRNSFARLINSYARNDLGLLKEKDANLTGADCRYGMQAIVSIRHPDPLFEGQTKGKLGSVDAGKAVDEVVKEQLTVYFDRNYEVVKDICERAVSISRSKAQQKNKIDLNKIAFESNGKLVRQTSRDPEECEIFIVEGDSAGGSAKSARDRKCQAILPLRGKIINVEKAPINRVLENAEICTIIDALGCGFSQGFNKDFDIEKLKYNKIIIMTDADSDGKHIATLLLTFFWRFYPQLILDGHIYVAVPPLYGIVEKDKTTYLYSDAELDKYRKSHKKNLNIQRYKGLGEMDADQLYETTMCKDNRRLLRISIESSSNAKRMTSILMGSEVPPRREFIVENSKDAVLDI